MKTTTCILIALCFLPGSPAPAAAADDPSAVRECRQAKTAALGLLGKLPGFEGLPSPHETAIERLGQAAEMCRKRAEGSKTPEIAAMLMAESYLARERLALLADEPQSRRIELLMDGIEIIRGLHHDRSPAQVELLRLAGYLQHADDAKYGRELVELAAEIADEAYGEDDVRVAEQLRYLGFLYAPSPLKGGAERPLEDPKEAERLYRKALEIHIRNGSSGRDEAFMDTLAALKGLFRATDREEDLEELDQYIKDVLEAAEEEAPEGHGGSPAPE